MPPESLPWDRKDFFRKRKHERSESLGSLNRWRDSFQHGSREHNRRGSTDFRRPTGHGKQGGWHLFPEEFGHGYLSLRSSEKMLKDESFRPISRAEGKYGRHSRETRGSYSQRDWKGPSSENINGSPNTQARSHDMNDEQRSHEDRALYSSLLNSDVGNTWVQHQFNKQHDKLGGCIGFGTGQKSVRDSSLGFNDWKPLKWSRSGSLCSRGSGFSHSNRSKSIGAMDSSEVKVESQINKAASVQSPSGYAAACVTSATPSEDTISRKKPRLGWGEGLTMYEKKKVDVPNFGLTNDGSVFVASNAEFVHSLRSNLVDESPRLMDLTDCASPATPSITSSSSPGVEEKSREKAVNTENGIGNLCGSLGPLSQNHLECSSFNLMMLDSNLIANIDSSLMELLESDDQSSVEPCYVRSTAMNKLLKWKGDFSKALEVTESEIDYLEKELKPLNSDAVQSSHFPATFSSLRAENRKKLSNDWGFVTNYMPRPSLLHIDTSGEIISERVPLCNGDWEYICSNAKHKDIDSPGMVTSKLVEPQSPVKTDSSSEPLNHGTGDLDPVQLTNREDKCSVSVSQGENTDLCIYCDGSSQRYGETCATPFVGLCKDKDGEEIIVEKILESNKESANEAYKTFAKLLPQHQCKCHISGVSNASSGKNVSLVKERFAMRKRFLKFKERVMTLKFKAFQQLWKEDMQLLSTKKYRAKSQKIFDLRLRTLQIGYQKHRFSTRTLFSSSEIIKCTKKLLLDSEVKVYRNILKMPILILDDKEKTISRFISNNGLVEDPCALEKEKDMINLWTQEEKDIFMDKLVIIGKDFMKIASFLDHKTTADCVEFYYKNHKSDSFKKIKKLDQGKTSNNTYLITSGKRWTREMNVASLGTASIMATCADSRIRSRQTYSRRLLLGGCSESKTSWDDDGNAGRPCSSDILGNEKETVAADVLAGISSSRSSEGMSSCITSSVDPEEGWKCQKVDPVTKLPMAPEVTTNVDDEICSDESCGEMDPTDWTDEEKSTFMQALSSYGRDFVMISRCVRTRSRDQCKVFFSKARKCLGLDSLRLGTIKGGTSVSDDANRGGSSFEDGCLLETASAMRSSKSGLKMDEDLPLSVTTINCTESDTTGSMHLQTALSRSDEINGEEQIDHKDVGTLDSLASDACLVENQAKLVSDGDSSNIMNVDKQPKSLPVQKSESVLVNSDADQDNAAENSVVESVPVFVGNEPIVVNPEPCVGMKQVDEVSADAFGNKLGQDGQNAYTNDQNSFELMAHDSSSAGSSSYMTAGKSSCSSFSPKPEHQHQMSFELDNSMGKHCVPLLSQETFAVIPCEKGPAEDKMSSTLDFQEQRDKCYNSDHRYENDDPLVCPPLQESSQVLRGYPLQIPIKKERNEDTSCRNLSDLQRFPKSRSMVNDQFVAQNCYLHKCNCSKPQHSLVSQKMEQTIDPPKSHLQSLSDSEKPNRNGNVKLFGQILGHPSSLPKEISRIHENMDNGSRGHKSSNKTSNLKFTLHDSDRNSSLLKFDQNNSLGFENVPTTNHNYWDTNRIQTAYSSLPDSNILLVKYPSLSNYSASSAKIEQQPLQGTVKCNDRHVNGPAREVSGSSGVIDYEVYMSRDGSKVTPFTANVEQQQDALSEMQRCSARETLPGLQLHGSEILGMNAVGRAGIIVGGSCTVSDPVTAIKLHYVRNDQFGNQDRSTIKEDE